MTSYDFLIHHFKENVKSHILPRYSIQAVFLTAKVSVCLSVTRVNCNKTNLSSAEILITHER